MGDLLAEERVGKIPEELMDFRNFLFLVWKFLELPAPSIPTPCQYEMAEYVQNGPRRRMVKGYRGMGKSYITSAYVCWRLLLNPQLRVLVISAAKDRASDFSTFTKRLIHGMDILKDLRPHPWQKDSVISFDVGPARAAHAPSVKSVGIFGAITGSRADLIVVDDMEIPNNSETHTARHKLDERSKEIEAVGSPGFEVVFLCTDQSTDSVYKRLQKTYLPKMWPARYPNADHLEKYGNWLADSIVADLEKDPSLGGTDTIPGKPVDPLRYSEEELQTREARYGPSGFALQFMLDPRLEDSFKYPLRISDLLIHPVDVDMGPEGLIWADRVDLRQLGLPNLAQEGSFFHKPTQVVGDYINWQGTVMGVDPSGRGRDELSFTIAKGLNGYIHIPLCMGLDGGYERENLERIAYEADKWKVSLIQVESNFGGGMFTELLKPILREIAPMCGVEDVPALAQKEKRICDTLEPLMSQHRLVIDPRVIQDDYDNGPNVGTESGWDYRLIHQMSRITRDKGSLRHDDRLDSLTLACSYWTAATAQGMRERVEHRQAQLERKEWDDFKKNVIFGEWDKKAPEGNKVKTPSLLRGPKKGRKNRMN